MRSRTSEIDARPGGTLRLSGEPTLERVSAIVAALRKFLDPQVTPEDADAIELGVTEALTNIVRHGFVSLPKRAIELRCEVRDDRAVINLLDGGSPLPEGVLAAADGSVFDFEPTAIEALPEGGMGLSLIKGIFQGIRYSQQGQFNHLTLVRYLSG